MFDIVDTQKAEKYKQELTEEEQEALQKKKAEKRKRRRNSLCDDSSRTNLGVEMTVACLTSCSSFLPAKSMKKRDPFTK